MGRKPGSRNRIKMISESLKNTKKTSLEQTSIHNYDIHIYKRFSGYEYAGEILISSDDVLTNLVPKICAQILEQNKKYYDNSSYNLLDIRAIEKDSKNVLNLSIRANIYDRSLNTYTSNVPRIPNSEALERKNMFCV